jgi:hypothetical protein
MILRAATPGDREFKPPGHKKLCLPSFITCPTL